MMSMVERDQIIAWLRSFDGLCERRIAEGAYIDGSTSHGEDRDMAGWFSMAADRIEAGEHLIDAALGKGQP